MIRFQPETLMIVGFFGVVIGFIVPFFTIVKIIEPNIVLLLGSYAASVGGLFLGLIGAAVYFRIHRRD